MCGIIVTPQLIGSAQSVSYEVRSAVTPPTATAAALNWSVNSSDIGRISSGFDVATLDSDVITTSFASAVAAATSVELANQVLFSHLVLND